MRKLGKRVLSFYLKLLRKIKKGYFSVDKPTYLNAEQIRTILSIAFPEYHYQWDLNKNCIIVVEYGTFIYKLLAIIYGLKGVGVIDFLCLGDELKRKVINSCTLVQTKKGKGYHMVVEDDV